MGPYLSAGILLAALWGNTWINWYLSLLGLLNFNWKSKVFQLEKYIFSRELECIFVKTKNTRAAV